MPRLTPQYVLYLHKVKWYKKLLETKTEVWRHIRIFGPDPTPCPGAAEVMDTWAQLGDSVGNKLQKWANNVKKCYFTIVICHGYGWGVGARANVCINANIFHRDRGPEQPRPSQCYRGHYLARITQPLSPRPHPHSDLYAMFDNVWQSLLWEDTIIIDRQTKCLHIKLCNLSAPQHRYC